MSNTKMSRAEDLLYTCQDRIRKVQKLLAGLPVEQEVSTHLDEASRALFRATRVLRGHLPALEIPGWMNGLDDDEADQ